MNKATIGVLSFIFGATVSGVVTYFVTKKLEKKNAEIYIQQQLEEDRKALRERNEEHTEEIKKDAVDEYCEQVRKERKEYRENARKYNTGAFVPYDPEDDDVKEALKKSRVDGSKDPYIITMQEFEEGGFDTKELFFHPDAWDVADEDGKLVSPSEWVGDKIFNRFADDDVDEIYVRNELLDTDIHLVKEMLK